MKDLTKDKFLSDEEVVNLKVALQLLQKRDPRNTALLELLLATGARCSEVLNVTKADLDVNEFTVYIRGTKNSRDREVPLSDDLFMRLLAISPDVGRLFPISYHRLLQIWRGYYPGKKGLHSIRHYVGVSLYRRTKDIKLVQTLLGHKSMTNTEVYLNFVSSKESLRLALLG